MDQMSRDLSVVRPLKLIQREHIRAGKKHQTEGQKLLSWKHEQESELGKLNLVKDNLERQKMYQERRILCSKKDLKESKNTFSCLDKESEQVSSDLENLETEYVLIENAARYLNSNLEDLKMLASIFQDVKNMFHNAVSGLLLKRDNKLDVLLKLTDERKKKNKIHKELLAELKETEENLDKRELKAIDEEHKKKMNRLIVFEKAIGVQSVEKEKKSIDLKKMAQAREVKKQQLKQCIDQEQMELQNVNKEFEEKQLEIKRLEKENEEARNKLLNAEENIKKIAETQKLFECFKVEINRKLSLEQELISFKAKKEKHEKEIEKENEEIDRMSKIEKNELATVEELEKKLAMEKETVSKATTKEAETIKEIEDLKVKLCGLQNDADEQRDFLDKSAQDIEQQIKRLLEKEEKVIKDHENIENELSSLKRKSENRMLEKENEKMENKPSSLKRSENSTNNNNNDTTKKKYVSSHFDTDSKCELERVENVENVNKRMKSVYSDFDTDSKSEEERAEKKKVLKSILADFETDSKSDDEDQSKVTFELDKKVEVKTPKKVCVIKDANPSGDSNTPKPPRKKRKLFDNWGMLNPESNSSDPEYFPSNNHSKKKKKAPCYNKKW